MFLSSTSSLNVLLYINTLDKILNIKHKIQIFINIINYNMNNGTPKIHNKLFTLNQSSPKKTFNQDDYDSCEFQSISLTNQKFSSEIFHSKNLRKKLDEFQKKQSNLLFEIAQLQNKNEFLQQRNMKVQEKNKQLIQKLSYEQICNKEIVYYNRKLEMQNKQLAKNIEGTSYQNREKQKYLNSVVQKNNQIGSIIKNILEVIKKCKNFDIFEKNIMKFKQYLERSVKFILQNHQIQSVLEEVFIQDSNHNEIYKKIKILTEQRNLLKVQIEQKNKIFFNYNQVLKKLRESCSQLKNKVDDIYNKSQSDKLNYQRIIDQKNDQINQIQTKYEKVLNILQKSKQRQQSLKYSRDSKKQDILLKESSLLTKQQNRTKKYFVGDCKKTKIKKELRQIDEQIQSIQKNIINQLKCK